MTKEEAIYCLESYQPDAPDDMCRKCKYYGSKIIDDNTCTCESSVARQMAIEALKEQQDWIPCSDPSDLPKDKRLWITREVYDGVRVVSNVIWDMTEWSDSVSDLVAYMPYWEPEPYTEGWKND